MTSRGQHNVGSSSPSSSPLRAVPFYRSVNKNMPPGIRMACMSPAYTLGVSALLLRTKEKIHILTSYITRVWSVNTGGINTPLMACNEHIPLIYSASSGTLQIPRIDGVDMPKVSDWEKLPPHLHDFWKALGAGWQATLARLRRKHAQYDSVLSPELLMSLVELQSPDRQAHVAPCCAGTGHQLKPRGMNQPEVWLLDRDDGLTRENIVLVSRGYYDLRRFFRLSHEEVRAWIEEAAAFYQANPGWNIADHPDDARRPRHAKEATDSQEALHDQRDRQAPRR